MATDSKICGCCGDDGAEMIDKDSPTGWICVVCEEEEMDYANERAARVMDGEPADGWG